MDALTELKALMKSWRSQRKGGSKGQAVYDLNRWKGEQRKALDAEYDRRLAEIEAQQDDPTDSIPEGALDLIAKALVEGASRSAIRIALGKQTLEDVDPLIQAAQGDLQQKVESGEAQAFTLFPAGEHTRGYPLYSVRYATGEVFTAVYITTNPGMAAKRHHMRLQPSPPGSVDILDRLWDDGVGAALEAANNERED